MGKKEDSSCYAGGAGSPKDCQALLKFLELPEHYILIF